MTEMPLRIDKGIFLTYNQGKGGLDMIVSMMDVRHLIPYAKNAKKHPKEQVEHIAASIREFGFQQPIVIDKDNVVVIGHGRLLAAKKLKLTQVPCVRADALSEEQIKALRLADNKTNESDWDIDLMQEDLSDILNIDMSDFGFDMSFSEEDTEIIEDEIPEQVEERVSAGDVWQLGDHRLICGDSTDAAVIERLMNGQKADMVFTDPPYGYNYQSNMRTKSEKFDVIENDDKILNFFPPIMDVVHGWVYVCTTWKTADKWMELFKSYYPLTNVIIWDKGGGGIGDLFHTFSTDYEMILVCNNGKELKGKRYGSVWNFTDEEITRMKKEELLKIVLEQKQYYSIWKQKKDNPNEYMHPTQKPVALSARAIRSSTDFHDNVLDVFGGSGSTLMACEQLKRRCFMCELDEHYCDVIITRWENMTGRKATKEG